MPLDTGTPAPPPGPDSEPASDQGGHLSATRPPLSVRARVYQPLLGLALAVFVLDQASKAWITAHVPFNPLHIHGGANDIVVARDFFFIIHVGNTGAAWSMFAGRSVILALLATTTLVAIYLWRHALGLRDRGTQLCFGLLCGGIAGNLVDRLLHGHVIDFIDLHFGRYVYPTFNVADSGICVGVILFLWQSLRAPR